MVVWSGRRRDRWREVLNNVRELISLRFFPPPLRRLVHVWCCSFVGCYECKLGLDLCHFDAKQAFVQSSLEEDVFMQLPPSCGEMSGKVVRLNRSLYGLKQASRSWHNHLLTHMKSLGFEQRPADACVMRLIESGSVSIVTVVHVDDICLLYTSPSPRD